jgi:hypothetical protein
MLTYFAYIFPAGIAAKQAPRRSSRDSAMAISGIIQVAAPKVTAKKDAAS